jgi:hypothetical protein
MADTPFNNLGNIMKAIIKASIWFALCSFIATAHANLLEVSTYNNIAYFADDQSTTLKRYSLEIEQFLAPLTLANNPKAVHVDSTGIYVSYGTSIVKLSLAGTGATEVRVTSADIYNIESTDAYLILAGYSSLQVLNKTSGTSVSTANLWYASPYISLSPDNSQIFTTSAGISPADIYQIPFASNGTIGSATESPYHGSYNIGDSPVAFPTQSRVVDSSGNVYNTMDLTFAGSLGGFYQDISFWQGLPIVLRSNALYSYNQTMLETGTYALNVPAQKIAVYLNKVFVFGLDDNGVLKANKYDISVISPADPVAAIDPTNLVYTPDEQVLDKDQDTIYLLSKANLNIFRWSISKAAYLPSIPLTNAPLQFAYAADQQRIYLSYANGAVNYIDLVDNKEHPFANAGGASYALTAAGQYVVVKGPTGAWGSLSVFDKEGTRTDYRDWIEPTSSVVWSNVYSRIYYIGQFSPSSLHWIELNTNTGKLLDGSGFSGPSGNDPIRISENGKLVALGSGRVVAGKTLVEQAALDANTYYKDVAWLHGNVFTIKGIDSNTYTQLSRWKADYTLDAGATYEAQGSPIGLVPVASAGKLVLIYSRNGKPKFDVLIFNVIDSDKDGYPDGVDALPGNAAEWLDFDDDAIGDNADTDDDNDGVNDSQDAFPLNPNETLDTDKDGIGNNADTDDDNDGVPDTQDAFPLDPKESKDLDHDGIGDNSDPDVDGDGVANAKDSFPLNAQEWLDTDKDGTGNGADTDDDNDGVADINDFYATDATRSAMLATDFFPMRKGSSWLYDFSNQAVVLGSEVKIAGRSLLPLTFPSGYKLYLNVVDNQIQLFGLYQSSIPTDDGNYTLDITFNKGINLTTSNNASGTGNLNITPKYGKKDLTWTSSTQYLGSESVAVPAGQYTALHTRVSYTATATIDGETLPINYNADIWFAENVGIVKMIEGGYPINLVSATIPEPEPVSNTGSTGASSGGNSGGGGSIGWLTMALLLLLTLPQIRAGMRQTNNLR